VARTTGTPFPAGRPVGHWAYAKAAKLRAVICRDRLGELGTGHWQCSCQQRTGGFRCKEKTSDYPGSLVKVMKICNDQDGSSSTLVDCCLQRHAVWPVHEDSALT
jgi:hypothetical protein